VPELYADTNLFAKFTSQAPLSLFPWNGYFRIYRSLPANSWLYLNIKE